MSLIYDAKRFFLYNRVAIEQAPLQTYNGLIFAPATSITRKKFKDYIPRWIRRLPRVEEKWNACLQTLEGHSGSVRSVAFSHDSTRLASASSDNTVKIWDASSGACLQTLEGHSDRVTSVAFSPDSSRLASASGDSTVKIWDASSGTCLQTLESPGRPDLISILMSLHSDTTVITPQQLVRQETTISAVGTWISNDAQKLLWLPTEFRPSCSAVSGRCVGLGTGSGKVCICRF